MSLKSKIEAVIYASEEPVTLAQLIGLLGEEGQTELDALADRQQSLVLEDAESTLDTTEADVAEDADALNAETLDPNAIAEAGAAEAAIASADPSDAASAEAENASAEQATEPTAPAVSDEKTLALATKARERRLREYFRSLLDQLIADYANGDRGLEIREVASGFRLGTKPEYHDAVRGFVKSLKPPLKLTLQALETLAVVAYKQPVTAPEVSEIRGVDSAGVLGSLMSRKLVTTAGRKQVIGRPILYKTTKDFLLRFGLKDINELPSIEEFEKMAGELNETLLDQEPDQEPGQQPDQASEAQAQETSMETTERSEKMTRDAPAPENAGGSPSVDEINSAPDPTHAHHDSIDDLLSDKSAHLEGHNHEHSDKSEVDPQESE